MKIVVDGLEWRCGWVFIAEFEEERERILMVVKGDLWAKTGSKFASRHNSSLGEGQTK